MKKFIIEREIPGLGKLSNIARKNILFAITLIVLGISACKNHIIDTPSPDGQPAAKNAPANIQGVFTRNCALSGCHSGAQSPNLSPGIAYNSIVNISSSIGLKYIEPGDPARSYLYLKITGASGISGSRMPQGRAPLSDTDIATIRTWIEDGAPEE